MSLSEKEVAELARSARLTLTAEELTRYAHDLEALEDLASALLVPFAYELAPCEPIQFDDLRRDFVAPGPSRDELLSLAPSQKDGYFAVPRAVEGL